MIAAHSARRVQGWGSFTIPGTHQGLTLLHFPSTNSAAHRPAERDIARLAALLNDDVWAFTNCRVDAPGFPVAEIDWFFYNTRTGSLILSEWKTFRKPVSLAADAGKPWLLADGTDVPNPVEQATKQQYAVREALRKSILPRHFPTSAEARVAVSVYSPQIIETTRADRLRFGKVYGALNELARVVQTLSSTTPLLLHDDGARLPLARALCALFRCSMSAEVEASLRPAQTSVPESPAAAVNRISEIHREIAKLHLELAQLTLAVEPPATSRPSVAAAAAGKPVAAAPGVKVKVVAVTEDERMRKHLTSRFKNVNGSKEKAAEALKQAWRAVLADPTLHGPHGISVSLFGSIATPLIKDQHGSLQKLVGMQPRKWCVLQAEQAGLKPRDVAGKPSNIRVR